MANTVTDMTWQAVGKAHQGCHHSDDFAMNFLSFVPLKKTRKKEMRRKERK
jgi:hypothetical protein